MIFKFTTELFELDLYGKNLSIIEENHWFTDQFFSQYSFPFEFNVNDDINTTLNFVSEFSAATSAKTFTGYLQVFGQEHEALLVIERIQGKMIQGKIKFGFEEFPNFDKKLSELPLENNSFTGAIEAFAATVAAQNYPAVNYNFPAIITDDIDTGSVQWQYFEGIINNYRSGAFLENEYDSANDEQINRNLMQPMPYLLHVLQQGFADAGYNLKGDILEDTEFKQALIVVLSDYYSNISADGIEFKMLTDEYDEIREVGSVLPHVPIKVQAGKYLGSVIITDPGVYKIAGTCIVRSYGVSFAAAGIFLDDERIFIHNKASGGYREFYATIDRNFEVGVNSGGAILTFRSDQMAYAIVDENQDPKATIFDVTITKLAGYDSNGNLIPALITPDKIDLRKCVPDITFGEFVKTIKNWRNYDLNVVGNDAIMNKIENEMQEGEIISLEEYEVKEPLREFYQDKSFLLQFQEQSSKDYSFDKVFVDNSGMRTSAFSKDEETNEITINGLPLPSKQSGSVNTAHLFVNNETLLGLAKFSGIKNGNNNTDDTSDLLLPAVYQNDYEDWLDFRLNAEGNEWTFICDAELAGRIKKKSRIYAYGRYHIIRRVTKKNKTPDHWEITVEQDGRH